MSKEPYGIDQLCKKWDYDINKVHCIIIRQNIRILVYIKNTIVLEAKINEINDRELSRLSKLSDEDMKKEGYTFTELSTINLNYPKKTRYVAKKESTQVIITYTTNLYSDYRERSSRDVSYEKYLPPRKVGRDDYFELAEESFIDIIDSLFSHKTWRLNRVKCERIGYVRFLEMPYSISLKDIYISIEEVNRLEHILNLANNEAPSSQSKTKKTCSRKNAAKSEFIQKTLEKTANNCNDLNYSTLTDMFYKEVAEKCHPGYEKKKLEIIELSSNKTYSRDNIIYTAAHN